jgi:hypothetical protein
LCTCSAIIILNYGRRKTIKPRRVPGYTRRKRSPYLLTRLIPTKKNSPFDRIALKLGNRKLEPDRTRRRPLLPKATLKARLPTAAHENRLPRLVSRLHGTSRRAGVASLRRAWSRWCGARSETNWRLGSATGRPESSAGRRDGVIAA